jgi:hypothetical protein
MRNKLSVKVQRKMLLELRLKNYELAKECRLTAILRATKSLDVSELVKVAKNAKKLSKGKNSALVETLMSQLNAKVESINKSMEKIIKLEED